MPCACMSKNKRYEVVLDRGTGRVAFTSSSRPTAETVAHRYPKSIVRDQGSGQVLAHAWPKGTYEVVHDGAVIVTGSDRATLQAAAAQHPGSVVRCTKTGTVVHPLAAALADGQAAVAQ